MRSTQPYSHSQPSHSLAVDSCNLPAVWLGCGWRPSLVRRIATLLPPQRRRRWQPRTEHLDARLRDQQHVLELRRRLAVRRDRRPPVRPQPVSPRAHVDHRLDGEAVACLHQPLGLVARVVRDRGRLVEGLADAVAAVRAVDRKATLLDVRCDHVANVTVAGTRLAHSDGHLQRVVGALDERLHLRWHPSANSERLVQVSVVAVDNGGDVDVDDVAIAKLSVIGDAVTHDLVHRRAHRLGEAAVVERRGVRPRLNGRLMHDSIDLIGRDADAHRSVRLVQDLAAEPCGAARLRRLRLGEYGRGFLVLRLDLEGGHALVAVRIVRHIRSTGLWHLPPR
mmetsp:Transcript_3660/g.9514  ORF Transcript_3660/g.9514 Transcript_3660/m.9514 type:complete len:337 (+) Transcript_3660:34-1044(+)